MAKVLMFRLSGKDYNAVPVKLERKKIYGWYGSTARAAFSIRRSY